MAFASLDSNCWRAGVPPVANVAAAKALLNSFAAANISGNLTSPLMSPARVDIASAGHQRGGAQVEVAGARSGMLQHLC